MSAKDKIENLKREWREGGKVAAEHRRAVAQEKQMKALAKQTAKNGKGKGK